MRDGVHRCTISLFISNVMSESKDTPKKKKLSTHVTHEVDTKRDELTESLADMLNKANKDGGKSAFFLDDKEDPSVITDWISTGSDLLDLAISNRPHGGIPVGRITEITGLEASGKSLLSAHLLAETQKKGGVAVFIDTEQSVSDDFLTAIGVNTKQMLYIASQTVEDIFEKIENIIAHVRKSNKDRLVTIVVDSVAAASTKAELEADHGKDGFATGKAIIISKAMRKINDMIGKQRIALIFTNQLRVNLQAAMFGDKYITSGGKALQFHASVRLRLKGMGALKVTQNGEPVHIGVKTRAVVVKNRLGPPMRHADFSIYYDSGIDNYGNWLEVLKKTSLITGAKSPYNYTKNDGSVIKLDAKTFAKDMKADAELREELYLKIVDASIMRYKSQDSEIREDVELDESDDDGDTSGGEE